MKQEVACPWLMMCMVTANAQLNTNSRVTWWIQGTFLIRFARALWDISAASHHYSHQCLFPSHYIMRAFFVMVTFFFWGWVGSPFPLYFYLPSAAHCLPGMIVRCFFHIQLNGGHVLSWWWDFPRFSSHWAKFCIRGGEKKKVSLLDKGSTRRCVWPALLQACVDGRGEAGAGRQFASSQWSWGGMPETALQPWFELFSLLHPTLLCK